MAELKQGAMSDEMMARFSDTSIYDLMGEVSGMLKDVCEIDVPTADHLVGDIMERVQKQLIDETGDPLLSLALVGHLGIRILQSYFINAEMLLFHAELELGKYLEE